jgi:hypothetical protein
MDDPTTSTAGRDRRLLLAAITVLGLVIAGLGYAYSDGLIDFVQSVTAGRLGHAQSRSLHY